MNQESLNRMMIGCLGAMTPILINLLAVDLQTTLSNVTLIEGLFYLVRLILLCVAACIVIFLNSDESKPIKLFQLGVAAPALLTGMINGAAINKQLPPSQPNAQVEPARRADSGTEARYQFALEIPSFTGSARAQGAATRAKVLDCTKPPDPSVSQQILKGLIGIVPDNQWFVVVSSNSTAENAFADVTTLNLRYAGQFHAEVCAPAATPDSRFRVVIGKYMTYADATNLKLKAIAAGLPGETWLWNPMVATN
jgi:hypothetical protein